METVKEIKDLILKTHGTYETYENEISYQMQLVSMLYRTVYDIESYWRNQSGVSDLAFRPKGLRFVMLIDFPALGWEFSIDEENKELCCINHLSDGDSRSTRIRIPLAYYEDREKYLDSVRMDMLEFAKNELKKQIGANERKIKAIERQMSKDEKSMHELNERLSNRGKKEDELF